jgi:hypothetical protein
VIAQYVGGGVERVCRVGSGRRIIHDGRRMRKVGMRDCGKGFGWKTACLPLPGAAHSSSTTLLTTATATSTSGSHYQCDLHHDIEIG